MNSCYIKMAENPEHLFHTFQCLAKAFHIRNSSSMNMFSSLTSAIKALMSLLISLCRQIMHIIGSPATVEKPQFLVLTSKM